MNCSVLELLEQHRGSNLLVDTNILLVYCVGQFRPALVPVFKRTCEFSVDDYKLLAAIWSRFPKRLTTPPILAEVTNYLRQQKGLHLTGVLHSLISSIELLDERYTPSKSLTSKESFLPLGLTDSAIADLAQREALVLTTDLKLWQFLKKNRMQVINFNHPRQIR